MVDRPRGAPVARGDRLSLDIESFGDGPDGLARVDGYVIYVGGAIPGERVAVQIVSAGRKYGRARAIEVERPSPDRVEPECRHFEYCGGCQLQHVALSAQRRAKTERLRKSLGHALRDQDVPIEEMRGPSDALGQRTKVALHFRGAGDRLVAGLFQRRSRKLVGIGECPVSDPLALKVAFAVRDGARRAGFAGWDPETDRGELRAVVVRSSPATGEAQATLVVRREPRDGMATIVRAVRDAGAVGLSLDRNDGPPDRLTSGDPPRVLWGRGEIHDEVDGTRYAVSAGAFFQTSSWGVRALLDVVREVHGAPSGGRVVDLYCGVGLFALAIAPTVERVVAIEEDEQSIEDAQRAAAAAGLGNVNLRVGRVERLVAGLARDRREIDAVIVGPPRSGLSRRVVAALLERLTPRRLVYVSSEPNSLGRDLGALVRGGYALERVIPVDMFPHTHHIEAVAVLRRERARAGDEARRRLLKKATGE